MTYVTGATGFTGRFVVDALLEAGEECRCLVRDSDEGRRVLPPSVDLVVGRLDDPAVLPGLADAEAVVHVAPIAICEGLLKACEEVGVSRAVYFSSTWGVSSVRTPEAEAVVAGEARVMAAGDKWTVLRPTMIYGSGDKNVSRLRRWIRARRVVPILDGGNRLVQPVYVGDVAQAVAGVLRRQSTHGRAYEVAGPEPMTYSQMVDEIAAFEDRRIVKVYLPGSLCALAGRVFGSVTGHLDLSDQICRMREDRAFSIDRACDDFAYHPRSFADGLACSGQSEHTA